MPTYRELMGNSATFLYWYLKTKSYAGIEDVHVERSVLRCIRGC